KRRPRHLPPRPRRPLVRPAPRGAKRQLVERPTHSETRAAATRRPCFFVSSPTARLARRRTPTNSTSPNARRLVSRERRGYWWRPGGLPLSRSTYRSPWSKPDMVTAICQSFARRAVQLALAGLVGAGVLLSVLPCPAARPNIVLFVTDDHGPDAGCYGNPVIRTPALDELASEGIRFTQAFSTTASCSASRSVILTGLYNHANAQFGHAHAYHHFRTYEDLKSLPVRLAEAGYRTARVGKLHVAPPEVYRFGAEIPGSPRSPVEMAENCRAFLEEAGEQPFFLYFCTADPHRSGTTPPGAAHAPDAFGNRPEGYPGVEEIQYDPDDVIVPSFLPDTPVCRAELAQYYQSVSRADQGLGQLASILRELNLYDNTLFVFTSDHGIAFP